jgi:hypothetical protein
MEVVNFMLCSFYHNNKRSHFFFHKEESENFFSLFETGSSIKEVPYYHDGCPGGWCIQRHMTKSQKRNHKNQLLYVLNC